MQISFVVERIKNRSRERGFKMKFLCSQIGVRENYFNDCKNKNLEIPDDILTNVASRLDTTKDYLLGNTDDPEFKLESIGMKVIPYTGNSMRPIVGRASAGLGVIAQQEILGYARVDDEYNNGDFFWLQVEGDSMSPYIDNGDQVLVQKDAPLESNTIMVVVVDDDDGFIKRVYIDEDTVTLQSYNPHYKPMVFGGSELSRLRFIGRVREIKRIVS